MKKQIFNFLLTLFFAFSVSAQDKEARKIDEFSILPCGDFMSRMHILFVELQDNPSSNIYVVYYSGRYRRQYVDWDKRNNEFNRIKLLYPHREDGINWAKSIPFYLMNYESYPETFRNSIKDKINLIEGGFRENTEVEIWLVPNGAEPPKPTPSVDEKYIIFSKDRPQRVRNFTNCYAGL